MNNITKDAVNKVVAEMQRRNESVEAIVRSIMKLKGARQADIARALNRSRSSINAFVRGKTASHTVNQYFKSTFHLDVRAMYAVERLENDLNISLAGGVK